MAEHNPHSSPGARPVGGPAGKRPAWLIPLLVFIVLLVLLLLLLSRCAGGDDDPSSAGSTATPSAPTATTTAPAGASTPSPASSDASSAAATTAGGTSANGAGTITTDQALLLPLADATDIGADGDLSAYTGTEATATAVRVQSVPADEGFWVGAGDTDRVWVQLTGKAGESPFTVEKGDAVSFTGQVAQNAAGFAKSAGVTDAEGEKLLNAQGQHITVATSAVTLEK
ncbi:hypothetical protein GCM10022223_18220 [Kineosporia mesophila]|uniref:DUF5666 domain-containing protein n=1 Tax=Kineosporia mesophila TaxID=566012 RepID=A0ABP6Z9F1_9ACTN|nr:hypothetical protein [Kineosporia mesophila]MCD5351941.1 hypothetical protein [Kineosporia mesophila]